MFSDPFVKISLHHHDKRIIKRSTEVKKNTLNPFFNETFVFDLPNVDEDVFQNIKLQLMVFDWDRLSKNEIIGHILFRAEDCKGTALDHWNEIISSPSCEIEKWHQISEYLE